MSIPATSEAQPAFAKSWRSGVGMVIWRRRCSVGKAYKTDDIFSYGENGVGDPQLYRVEQGHVSQEDWLPSENRALYTPIGLTEEGYPVWSRPTGGHDAYNIGDIVDYNGALYKSLMNGNTYSPDEYPAGWEVVTE